MKSRPWRATEGAELLLLPPALRAATAVSSAAISIRRAVAEHPENWIPETLIWAPGGELNQMALEGEEEALVGCMHLSCTEGSVEAVVSPDEMSMLEPVKTTYMQVTEGQ